MWTYKSNITVPARTPKGFSGIMFPTSISGISGASGWTAQWDTDATITSSNGNNWTTYFDSNNLYNLYPKVSFKTKGHPMTELFK